MKTVEETSFYMEYLLTGKDAKRNVKRVSDTLTPFFDYDLSFFIKDKVEFLRKTINALGMYILHFLFSE